MSIKVALVIGQLSHGGAERQLFELARRLPSRGYEPLVISLSSALHPYGPDLEACGVKVQAISRMRSLEPRRVVQLARMLKTSGAEMVHAFLLVANAYAWMASRLSGLTAFLPSVRSKETSRPRWLHLIDRFVLRRSQLVLVNSNHLAEWTVERYGVSPARVRCVPNGLDLSRFDTVGSPRRRRERPARIGSVCLFKPVKRIPFMLEAARRVARQRPGTTMIIAGDGPERPAMLRLRDRLGLQEVVEMPGPVPDAVSVLSGVDVFILASENEGMPNVVLEAMAAGRPIVGTNVPGIVEVVREGESGYLVAPEDLDGFVSALLRIIDHPEHSTRMGDAARRRVRACFSADRMIERTVAVYEELLAGPCRDAAS